ncbi:MAG TPA: phosphoribosylanthranilate isomerase [Chloroflexia bacterium]|nr:phosphoribosylanthranilate isomerase [Chloroflexia bacterium]
MMLYTELQAVVGLYSRGPRVKVCGIMEPGHARVAAACGADMVGVVFAPSKRQVSIDRAKQIRAALDESLSRPQMVGVFVNEAPEAVCEVARRVGLDVVQLSGDEIVEDVAKCARSYPVIKALRFEAGTSVGKALQVADNYASLGDRVRLLVDAHHAGHYGGTGQVADWSLAAELADRHEIILAGGLNPRNVSYGLAAVMPWAVDVSTGVESGGAKDAGLIRAFVDAARLGVVVG